MQGSNTYSDRIIRSAGMFRTRRLILCSAFSCLSACASILPNRPSPTVAVASIWPLWVTQTYQIIGLELRLNNPHKFELPLLSMDFNLFFEGRRIAQGVGYSRGYGVQTVPANGEATLEAEVRASILGIKDRIEDIFDNINNDREFSVAGLITLQDRPKRIPFNDTLGIDNLIRWDEET